MKMKTTTIISLLLTIIILTACRRERIHCPAFDTQLLYSWFPYTEEGSTYTFADENGNKQRMVVGDVSVSEPHVIVRRGCTPLGCVKVGCNIYGEIHSLHKEDDLDNIELRIKQTQDENGSSRTISIQFQQVGWAFNVKDAQVIGQQKVIADDPFYLDTLAVLDVNGKEYSNVIVVKAANIEVANRKRMDKVYLVKGQGFVGYRTYPEGREYWLQ